MSAAAGTSGDRVLAVVYKYDPNAGNSRVAVQLPRAEVKCNFEHYRSSELHADGSDRLRVEDFLLVYCSVVTLGLCATVVKL